MKQLTDSMSAQLREVFFDSLARHATTVLKDINIEDERIDIAVAELASLISEDHAGQHLYIPTDYFHRSMERQMAVYNAVNGRNYAQVAHQFGCSDRTVYRIYKRVRKMIVAQSQHDMFNQ